METLVLDVSYLPVARVPWETAIVWVLDKVVDIVEHYPDKHIRTVSWTVDMPSVVRFVKPFNRRKAIKFSRHNIYLRDKGRCQYCSNFVSRNSFTYEHVVPKAQGGRTTWENVVVACVSCNQRKGGRTPEQAKMRLLSKPVKPKSLPDHARFTLTYQPGMPQSWKDWLRDSVYWDGSLSE